MPKYIESEILELKEKYTDVICKEIVSFLNASGGMIVIGVKDDGTVVGVDKIDETFKKISDIITTQIEPNPQDDIDSGQCIKGDQAYLLSEKIWFFICWMYH